MKRDKDYLRSKFLLKRKKNHIKIKKFNFDSIFNLIKKNFLNKKITIASYYPSNYEVNTLNFLEKAQKKKFKLALPVIKPLGKMSFKYWVFKEPLYTSTFGTLEPKDTNKQATPDIIMVPLVAFDHDLNRIGYGKGYYDRILEKIRKVKKKVIFLGIAYSFQKCKKIPINKYDFKLDYILTEQGIISPCQ
jgi:5-formyltetrahydrofolate cyclo-ligase|tara:strand:+ start:32 stop:601 length:570 start_codon:yes stop_codon:yes gene_type:complete